MRHGQSVPLLVVLSIALMAVLAADVAGQPSLPVPPPPGQAVSDGAGLVNKDDAATINRMAAALVTEKGYPIAVVTVRSLAAYGAAGATIERFAAELLKAWPAERNFRTHGLLLVVAADHRAARVQLGTAWGAAHDERARRVMDRMILPAFKSGEFSRGIVDGVRGFDAMGRQLPFPPVGQPSWYPSAFVVDGLEEPWWLLPALIAGVIVLAVGLVSVAKGGRRSWAWAAGAFIFALLLSRFFGGSAEASDSEGGATGNW
jgi:uncharacterized protein